MAKLFTLEAGRLNAFNGRLHEAGLTAEEADRVQADKEAVLARVMVSALRGHLRPAAEDADRIVIIDSGYDGGAADQQRGKGPYFTYPQGWVPNSAIERAKSLAPHFPGVDFSHVEELAARFGLEEHADGGLLVWPKLEAIVRCVRNPRKSWQPHNIAMEYILGVFKEIFPNFYDATNGKVAPEYERMFDLTAKMLAKLDAETPGDVHVEAFNAGALFAGYSVRSSRGHMEALKTHLPATNIMNFCRAISDPKSFANGSLVADCPGVERAPGADGGFCDAPFLGVGDDRLCYRSSDVGRRAPLCGSTSVVLRAAA